MMMIVRNKDNCILNNTAPVPWPSPLTRVVSLDSLSPVLSLTGVCGSWQTPLSWSHHLSPHWTSLWARDSAQSSRARVTSSYSHCELSLPSAGDQISGLDHFVDGSEFRTRDLQNIETIRKVRQKNLDKSILLFKDHMAFVLFQHKQQIRRPNTRIFTC